MADNTRIVVSTQRLLEAAENVDTRTEQMRKAFDSIERIVDNMRSYWEGDGQQSSYAAYKRKTDRIRAALVRFTEETNSLRIMDRVDKKSGVRILNQFSINLIRMNEMTCCHELIMADRSYFLEIKDQTADPLPVGIDAAHML